MPKKVRDSNIELYRIILMLLIIAHHYVVNSGLTGVMNENVFSIRTVTYHLLGMWGKTGINCFVLITGYYMCTSSINIRKFLKLLLEIEFYNVIIYLIFLLSGYEPFTLKGAFYAFWPIQSISNGFAPCFLIFYLFIPFLNVVINNIERKNHIMLIALLVFIYTLLGDFPLTEVRMNYVTWFCVLYFIGAYLRIYNAISFWKKNTWGGLLGLVVLLAVISVLLISYVDRAMGKDFPPVYFMKETSSFLALVIAICAFCFFKSIKISYSRVINILASSSFGVLMIHANSDAMRRWLWKDLLHVVDQYYSDFFLFHLVASVAVIYAVCTLIDQIRILLFEKPVMANLDKLFDNG